MMDGVVGGVSCSHEREGWNALGPEREAVRSLPGEPNTCLRQFGQQHRLVCDSPTNPEWERLTGHCWGNGVKERLLLPRG